jgi:hypothetical protein
MNSFIFSFLLSSISKIYSGKYRKNNHNSKINCTFVKKATNFRNIPKWKYIK